MFYSVHNSLCPCHMMKKEAKWEKSKSTDIPVYEALWYRVIFIKCHSFYLDVLHTK